jgi:hypothetical protein
MYFRKQKLPDFLFTTNWDDQIKLDEIVGTCSMYGRLHTSHKIAFGRKSCREVFPLGVIIGEDNIKRDLNLI